MEAIIKTVKIGNQVWISENLNVSAFRNGDPIPEAKTYEEWDSAREKGTPAWCYYENDPENGKKYSKLYNWYAVNDPRGLAPEGWHIPSKDELEILLNKYGGEGSKAYNVLIHGGASGFSSLFGGWRGEGGDFGLAGVYAGYWSTTQEDNKQAAWNLSIDSRDKYALLFTPMMSSGCSVRCVKD